MMVEREILDIGAAVDKMIEDRLGRMFTVNLNDTVKVKLTDVGKHIYYHRYDTLNWEAGRQICEPKFPNVDSEGYTSFQLWDFINLYGNHIFMGYPNVIEPLDILCPMKGHKDPPGEPGPRGRRGKWVRNKNNGLCYCSACDAPAPVEDVHGETISDAPYCYRCGADMREG